MSQPGPPPSRHLAFTQAQKIREKHRVRGMLTLQIDHPHRIELKFCPEIWEMPERFLAEFANLPGPNLILGVPVEHIPYHKEWVKSDFGQHLLCLREKAGTHSPTHKFLTDVIRFLHLPGIGECLAQETPPRCEREAFQRWNSEDHPVWEPLAQILT